jgi:sulfotransferase family protein
MEDSSGPAGGVPAFRTAGGPPPIWQQTRQPPWVKLINVSGAGLRRVGVRWPRLDPDAMMAEARRRSRLSDFGDGRFREGLRVLVDSFNAQDTTHAFGRLFFREYCTNLLVNRLAIQADLTRHPEIFDVPVNRPLFITGLPRSGTTFLHRLMSEDPAGRTLLLWEAMEPSPPPRRETRATDPRIARARKQIALLHRLSPALATAHKFEAESPEEDNNLYAHAFAAGILGFLFDVPDFVRWLEEQDYVGSYGYARQQLQLLSWKCPGDYWILKSPGHQFSLDALLTVFPDACVVLTHRDPLRVIPSLCSLMAALRGILTDRLDLQRLGAECVEALSVGPERAIASRGRFDPSRFFDVSYDRLVAEPVETVRAVCRHFGYSFGPDYESRTRRWLAENPQHKHGVHRYRLDDFGLDAATVERFFAGYREWLVEHKLAGGG